MLSWIYLGIAAVFEIGWPLGFKLAHLYPQGRIPAIAASVAAMALSGYCLYLAQRTIPIGTAYAVWTGIGAFVTVLIGIIFFEDPATLPRLACLFAIMAGVIGLKLIG